MSVLHFIAPADRAVIEALSFKQPWLKIWADWFNLIALTRLLVLPWPLREHFMTTLSRSPPEMMDERVRVINYTMSSASARFLFALRPWRLLVSLWAERSELSVAQECAVTGAKASLDDPRHSNRKSCVFLMNTLPISLSLMSLIWNLLLRQWPSWVILSLFFMKLVQDRPSFVKCT